MLQHNRMNAATMHNPPTRAAAESGSPLRNQSTKATRKMVSSAATEDKTGDVREMRTRKDPENAKKVSAHTFEEWAGAKTRTGIGEYRDH